MVEKKVIFNHAIKLLKSNALLIVTLIAVVMGFVFGLSLQPAHLSNQNITLLGFPGEIFLRLLKLLIIPLIFASIVNGIISLDLKNSGRIALRCMVYYLSTTILAIILGLILVSIIKPGVGRELSIASNDKSLMNEHRTTMDSILDIIRNIFPDNLVKMCFTNDKTTYVYTTLNDTNNVTYKFVSKRSLTSTDGPNMIGVVSMSFALGLAILVIGEAAEPFVILINSANIIVMKLMLWILWFSPIGIFSLISAKIAETDDLGAFFSSIGLYMLTVLVGLVIHGYIVLPLIYFIVSLRNPFKLIWGISPALLVAFGISSSSGTMPITIRCLEQKLKIDPRITQFVIPIGTTINMDGTALYEAVASIFLAQLYGLNLSFIDIVLTGVTATLASIGAAAIPSAGLITILIVLNILGIPSESISTILAIDWFLDRCRTTVNVLGDSFGAGIVESLSAKELDLSSNPGINKYIPSCKNIICRKKQYTAITEDVNGVEIVSNYDAEVDDGHTKI